MLDGAVTVFDGKMGVEPQSETVWRQADKYKVPRICFINKINQTGGDFYKSLDSIKDRLSKRAFPGSAADRRGAEHQRRRGPREAEGLHLPGLQGQGAGRRRGAGRHEGKGRSSTASELIEAAVEVDDALMEKYLEGAELTEDELKVRDPEVRTGRQVLRRLRRGRPRRDRGNAARRRRRLPAEPARRAAAGRPRPEGRGKEITGEAGRTRSRSPRLAFKVTSDPFVGTLTFFRVYSGNSSRRFVRAEHDHRQQGTAGPDPPDARQLPAKK